MNAKKINHLKRKLRSLDNGESIELESRIADVKQAIDLLELNNREFTIDQSYRVNTLIVTCHYEEERYSALSILMGFALVLVFAYFYASTSSEESSCCVSNSQLYKMAGNGWTDEVIAHIIKPIT